MVEGRIRQDEVEGRAFEWQSSDVGDEPLQATATGNRPSYRSFREIHPNERAGVRRYDRIKPVADRLIEQIGLERAFDARLGQPSGEQLAVDAIAMLPPKQ